MMGSPVRVRASASSQFNGLARGTPSRFVSSLTTSADRAAARKSTRSAPPLPTGSGWAAFSSPVPGSPTSHPVPRPGLVTVRAVGELWLTNHTLRSRGPSFRDAVGVARRVFLTSVGEGSRTRCGLRQRLGRGVMAAAKTPAGKKVDEALDIEALLASPAEKLGPDHQAPEEERNDMAGELAAAAPGAQAISAT